MSPIHTRSKIFISYRRAETASEADRLRAALCNYFHPDSVFLDSASISPGADWAASIRSALSESCAVIVLIGRDWIEQHGQRLRATDDWVHDEIDSALRNTGTTVIPVVLEDVPIPASADLPEDLRRLPMFQALRLSSVSWDADISRLARSTALWGVVRARPLSQEEISKIHEEFPDKFELIVPTIVSGVCALLIISSLVGFLIHRAGGNWIYAVIGSAQFLIPALLFGLAEFGRYWKTGTLSGLGPTSTLIACKIYQECPPFQEDHLYIPMSFFIATAVLLYWLNLPSWHALWFSLAVETVVFCFVTVALQKNSGKAANR